MNELLGSRIKALRIAKNLTQEQVADQKVLKIQHRAAKDRETVPAPDIVAKNARHGQQGDQYEIHQAGLHPRAAC